MKVLVLCVDALEYNFVEPRKYPNLKQQVYGQIPIPKEWGEKISWDWHGVYEPREVYTPFTPTIWATILTGTKPSVHGYTREKAKKDRVIPIIGKRFHKRYKTFIDLAHNPLVVNLPFRGYGYSHPGKWVSAKDYIMKAQKVFHHLRKDVLQKITGEHDLFLCYFKLLDHAGHVYWRNMKTMKKYYDLMEATIGEITSKREEAFTIIVSDHGMEPLEGIKFQGGQHSFHSFYSLNKEVKPLPKTLLDFYSLVKRSLKT